MRPRCSGVAGAAVWFGLLLTTNAPAAAQPAPKPAPTASASVAPPLPASARPDPTDAQAVVPRVVHASPLAGYRRLSDQPVRDWREAIDQVQRIGGWRAYLRDPVPLSPPPAASAARSATSQPEAARSPSAHRH